MNDTELDEILNSWSPPAVPASLRRRVRDGLPGPPRRRAKWIVATILAAAAFFLIVTAGVSAGTRIRFGLHGRWIRNSSGMRATVRLPLTRLRCTAHHTASTEMKRSRRGLYPGIPSKPVLGLAIDMALPVHNRVMARLMLERRADGTEKAGSRFERRIHNGVQRGLPDAGTFRLPKSGPKCHYRLYRWNDCGPRNDTQLSNRCLPGTMDRARTHDVVDRSRPRVLCFESDLRGRASRRLIPPGSRETSR